MVQAERECVYLIAFEERAPYLHLHLIPLQVTVFLIRTAIGAARAIAARLVTASVLWHPHESLPLEQLDYNLIFRWFVGLSPDDPTGTRPRSPRTEIVRCMNQGHPQLGNLWPLWRGSGLRVIVMPSMLWKPLLRESKYEDVADRDGGAYALNP